MKKEEEKKGRMNQIKLLTLKLNTSMSGIWEAEKRGVKYMFVGVKAFGVGCLDRHQGYVIISLRFEKKKTLIPCKYPQSYCTPLYAP